MVQGIRESSYLQATFRDAFAALALPPALPLCAHNCFCSQGTTHLARKDTGVYQPGKQRPELVRLHEAANVNTHHRCSEGQEKSFAGALGNTALLPGLLRLLQQGTLAGLLLSLKSAVSGYFRPCSVYTNVFWQNLGSHFLLF